MAVWILRDEILVASSPGRKSLMEVWISRDENHQNSHPVVASGDTCVGMDLLKD
jgi:hypothetical protein